MKRIIAVLLLASLIIGLAGCFNFDYSPTETSSTDGSLAAFDTVEKLRIAARKYPEQYISKQISVKGYASTREWNSKRVWLYDNLLANNELYDDRPRIEVIIPDSIKLALIEEGDYIDVLGILEVIDGELVLTNCTYMLLRTHEEIAP